LLEIKERRNRKMKKLLFGLIIVIWAFIGLQCPVSGQISFPTGPVTIWVGHAAGGSTDITMRALTAGAEKSLGQKILIINKPGAAGTVCASLIVKEKPDGYTLAAFPDPPVTRSPHLRDLDYDPFQDLSFIMRVGKWKNIFAVRADSPFKKWRDVVDWAKKNPGQLTFGHPGAATAPNFAMIRIGKKEGFTYKNVPFIGDAPTVSALLGGHVMIAGLSSVIGRSHAEAKTISILLTYEKESLDYAPEVPTFEKIGYYFEFPTDVIICGPKGISNPIREILEKAFVEGTRQEAFRKVAKDDELIGQPLTGKAMVDYLKENYRIYEEAIKEAGLYKIEKK